ncbi:hypothetical protein JCM10450v2_003117 [Rhodotorula kratochvilovae]
MPAQEVFQQRDGAVFTTSQGAPVANPHAHQRAGPNGPLLLQDFHLIDVLSHFNRERIPERVVHAKGAGAHGTLEITDPIADLTSSEFLSQKGKCSATVRFSTVGGESGSADTARDPRGFSVKLRTEQGNWDIVGNNTPVFFLRDPIKFPQFIQRVGFLALIVEPLLTCPGPPHSTQKRDPQTHLKDADMFWDYLTQNTEAFHQVMILFGDRGVPNGYRHMHGYAGHTLKLVKADGSFVYAQFHFISNQGTKFFTQEEADKIAGQNADYATQDLFEAIQRGEHPSWDFCVQIMTPEQAEKFRYNILDLTKIWPHSEYPLRKIGKLTLNENVKNYFAEVEQAAFAPSHLIPGVEPSADPVLQSRLFAYPDAHRYRLSVNYAQLPVNAPVHLPANFQRDGQMAFHSQGNRPGYPSTIQPLSYKPQAYTFDKHEQLVGTMLQELSEVTELDFEQPRALWEKVFDDAARRRFISNVAGHLGGAKSVEIKKRAISVFAAIHPDIGAGLSKALNLPSVPAYKPLPASEALAFRLNRSN